MSNTKNKNPLVSKVIFLPMELSLDLKDEVTKMKRKGETSIDEQSLCPVLIREALASRKGK